MPLSEQMKKLQHLFLFDTAVQAQLKATKTDDEFLNEAIAIARNKGLDSVTVAELKTAIEDHAKSKANEPSVCTTSGPPVAKVDDDQDVAIRKAIAKVRSIDFALCAW